MTSLYGVGGLPKLSVLSVVHVFQDLVDNNRFDPLESHDSDLITTESKMGNEIVTVKGQKVNKICSEHIKRDDLLPRFHGASLAAATANV